MAVETLEDVFNLPSVLWEDRALLPDRPGVYFAIADDLLIYIGKSDRTLRQRWRYHSELSMMRYFGDILRIAYLETDDPVPEERRLIRLFEPAMNTAHVPGMYSRRAPDWPHLREGWDRNRKRYGPPTPAE